MKITAAHLQFWRERKSNPAWAAQVELKPMQSKPVSVHALINAQAGKPKASVREINNMVNVLRRAYRNEHELRVEGEFLRCLSSYALPRYSTTSRRQAATARKWLAKIGRGS